MPPKLTLEELQLEAVRGVIEDLLTSSPTADPSRWAMSAISEISRILGMTTGVEVMMVLHDQEERRASQA